MSTSITFFLKDKLIVPIYDFFMSFCHIPWRYYCKKKFLNSGGTYDGTPPIFNGRCYLQISRQSLVHIGRNFIVNSGPDFCIDTVLYSKIEVYQGGRLLIGNDSGMSNTIIQCKNSIIIGNNVKFGAGCLIMDSNFHSLNYQKRRNFLLDGDDSLSAPIVIEDDVFIGARSLILKGVTIGARSIIAAGSVVVHSIPSDCIAGGNPCMIIKMNINRE